MVDDHDYGISSYFEFYPGVWSFTGLLLEL